MSGCQYQPEDLLAHRSPMLFLDEILDYDDHSLRAGIDVHSDKPFCAATGAPGWVGLEWLAQTAGAWVGAQQRDHGQSVELGFLLGTRCYRGPYHFPPGRVIAESLVVLYDEESGIAAMDGVVRSADDYDNILATSRIKLYQPHDVAAFLEQQTQLQS